MAIKLPDLGIHLDRPREMSPCLCVTAREMVFFNSNPIVAVTQATAAEFMSVPRMLRFCVILLLFWGL